MLFPEEALRIVDCEPIREVMLRWASSRLGKKWPLGVSHEDTTVDRASSVGVEEQSSKVETLGRKSPAAWSPVKEVIAKQTGACDGRCWLRLCV